MNTKTTYSSGIFRYAADLPETQSRISLGEGSTPVVHLARLGERIGVPNLFAKLEGNNPTGSYKDRVAAMSISVAVDMKMAGWIATSSGNAGTSLAAYGNRAGLPGFLAVVPSIPREKLLPILGLGNTQVFKIEGVGDKGDAKSEGEMFERVREAADEYGLFLGVTAHKYNDIGMHGADTIAFELDDAGFEDSVVYVPTGGGGLVSAICRGFKSRNSSARVVAAQPSGCAPIASYLQGEIDEPIIARCETGVSGLQLPSPPDGRFAADWITKTQGWGTSASDDAISSSQQLLATLEGLLVEPASATALAAVLQDRKNGKITVEDTAVLILTSTGLKHLASVEGNVKQPASIRTDDLPSAIDNWASALPHKR